jgi:hypothetical protein
MSNVIQPVFDPFDPENLRLDQSFVETSGVNTPRSFVTDARERIRVTEDGQQPQFTAEAAP